MKNKKQETNPPQEITRKEAIKKVGITALASASLLLLKTKAASAVSPQKRIPANNP